MTIPSSYASATSSSSHSSALGANSSILRRTPAPRPEAPRNAPPHDHRHVHFMDETQPLMDRSLNSNNNNNNNISNHLEAPNPRYDATLFPPVDDNAVRQDVEASLASSSSVPSDQDSPAAHPPMETPPNNHDDQNPRPNAVEEEPSPLQEPHQLDDVEQSIALLTRRLRCLFALITWPIVPLGILATLTFLWMMYAAFFLDVMFPTSSSESSSSWPPCLHLHVYALISLLLVTYAPHHTTLRSRLFQRSHQAVGRSARAMRRYDQLFHTLALLYVYWGITLVQSCKSPPPNLNSEDPHATPNMVTMTDGPLHHHQQVLMNIMLMVWPQWAERYDASSPTASPLSDSASLPPHRPSDDDLLPASNPLTTSSSSSFTCAATCPHLFPAMSLYVATLEGLTLSLIIPLLFLPCLYWWFLRRAAAAAAADPQSWALWQEQWQQQQQQSYINLEEEAAEGFLFRARSSQGRLISSWITADQILQQVQEVKLIRRRRRRSARGDNDDDEEEEVDPSFSSSVWVVPVSSRRRPDVPEDSQVTTQPEQQPHDPEDWRTVGQEKDLNSVKECCICMCDFVILEEDERAVDVETGQGPISDPLGDGHIETEPPLFTTSSQDDAHTMVQTRACGHLFHRQCLAGWVGGPGGETTRPRRARRTTCPLCRHDLRPAHLR